MTACRRSPTPSTIRISWSLPAGVSHAQEKGQHLDRTGRSEPGIKEVDDGIWLVSFMHYELGYIDLEQKTLQTIDNPFGPRLSSMS
jgi:hypothetical protein